MSDASATSSTARDRAVARRARPLRQAQKDLTRQRLVDAGLEVFRERGYESATVEEIADRANMGRSTFYSHFQSKADVATAVALSETGPLNVAVAGLGDTDPRDAATIDAWLDSIERMFLSEDMVITLVMQHIEVAQEFLLIQRRSAEEALVRFAAAGWKPRVENPTEHLRLLMLLVNRWLYLHAVHRLPTPDGAREALVELIGQQLTLTMTRTD